MKKLVIIDEDVEMPKEVWDSLMAIESRYQARHSRRQCVACGGSGRHHHGNTLLSNQPCVTCRGEGWI